MEGLRLSLQVIILKISKFEVIRWFPSIPEDVCKIINAPILHVNGHDPEAVIHAANVAAEWRAIFHKDIFLDVIAYRRHGHNEGDEAMFTQPIMYTKIHQTKPISETYSEKLIGEGIVNAKEVIVF